MLVLLGHLLWTKLGGLFTVRILRVSVSRAYSVSLALWLSKVVGLLGMVRKGLSVFTLLPISPKGWLFLILCSWQ